MSRLGTASIAALALAVALIGAPSAGAARAATAPTEARPAKSYAFVKARGTNGWGLQITAILGSGQNDRRHIGFYARGPHHQEVSYSGPIGRATERGRIAARLPGLGRVDVRFEQTGERPVEYVTKPDCKTEGKSATLFGVFRGTIELRGEGGYTTVDRRSAPGQIEVIPRVVCPRPKRRPAPPTVTAEEAGIELLSASRDEGSGGSLRFEAWGSGLTFPGTRNPITDFSATYTHERGKVSIFATTSVLGQEKGQFSLTAPNGTPIEATVAPPAPFTGSAAFELESPTTASWTGDLSVEIPTLGTVDLTGPGFQAGACAAHCAKTFPSHASFGVVEFQTIS